MTQELSRGANIVQTPRATPAGPATMVGVCFLSQMLTADSLNCLLSTLQFSKDDTATFEEWFVSSEEALCDSA